MKSWIVAAGLLAALTAALAPAGAEEKGKAGACFARLKSLAGDWISRDAAGKETLALRYRVTGGGSAVEETVFPGSPHEMVTMYTLDGDHLVLTHYCAIGNQPRMKATAASTPERLEFEWTGVGNAKSHDETHMHHALLTFQDADHFTAVWTGQQNGQPGHVGKFEVSRKK